jgi:hypothetical protein
MIPVFMGLTETWRRSTMSEKECFFELKHNTWFSKERVTCLLTAHAYTSGKTCDKSKCPLYRLFQLEEKKTSFEEEKDLELRLCEPYCPHFDVILSRCWLITDKTTGPFTEVRENEPCIHGFNRDMEKIYDD